MSKVQSLGTLRGISWVAVALTIYLSSRLLPLPAGLSDTGQAVLGVAFAGVALWVSEAVPLGFIAFFVLALLGMIRSGGEWVNFAGFASPVVFFLIGSVALGTAVETTGLAGRIGKFLVRRAGGSPRRLYVQMLISLPGLAFLMPSAITRNAVLIPAYCDTLTAMGINQSGRIGRALMLALGILNPLASSALLTGGITSMTASEFISDLSWFRWFALMAVPYYLLILLGAGVLRLMVGRFEEHCVLTESSERSPPFSVREKKTLAVFLLVSFLWLTDFIHGWSPAIPALLGAVLLVCPVIGVLTWKDFEARLSWGLVLTVGASLSLAHAMTSAGTTDWLGQQFILMSAGITQRPLILLAGIIIAATVIHIAITNLAACVALLIPIAMTVAHTAGLNPTVCALIVTIATNSVILYPTQTASNLIAYEGGYFGATDVGRFGLAMLALTIVVGLGVAVPYWGALGLPLLQR